MPKRFVSRRLHGYLDFLTVGLILVGPEVFRVKGKGLTTEPARAFALGVGALSVLTDYGPKNDRLEFGGPRMLSMRTHVKLDAIGAITVGVLPFVTGSWRKGWNYWAPQLLVASSETFFALTTKFDD
ncbi:MAG TPA: hypothetical protein VFJ78_09710 [Gaiellaceae bacterium]|nr:hypothetical protein [Gaiellaceae bacterium]